MRNDRKNSWKRLLVAPLLSFGALCLLTALVLSFISSEEILKDYVPAATGGIVGPFTIEEGGTVLSVEVSQSLPLQTWSFVSLALLDERKQWLIGFGDEFWHESGIDSEGYHWNEAVAEYEAHLTIPEDGRYYLQVKPESNLRGNTEYKFIFVRLTARGFSTIPHFAVGILAVIIGLSLSFISRGTAFTVLKET